MKPNLLIKPSTKNLVKIQDLRRFAAVPKNLKSSGLAFSKDFKAAVLLNKKGSPGYFVFDTHSLWNLLCAIDSKYEESASAKKYIHENPVGWLIDAIESHLPVNPKLIQKLKRGIREAEKSGFISLEKVMFELSRD